MGRYDGNVIGGLILGAGMALSGACPGTVLVQVVVGAYPGLYSLVGGILGGILYIPLRRLLPGTEPQSARASAEKLTVDGALGVDRNVAIMTLEGMVAGALVAIHFSGLPTNVPDIFIAPTTSGLLIGTAQLISLVLRGNLVGISTAYEEVGAGFWAIVGSLSGHRNLEGRQSTHLSTNAIWFSAGVMIGAFAFTRYVLSRESIAAMAIVAIPPARAVLGGITLVLGARLAGGCTSGHGIGGLSLLSTSSLITVVSMFGGGIGLALLI